MFYYFDLELTVKIFPSIGIEGMLAPEAACCSVAECKWFLLVNEILNALTILDL